MLCVTQVCDMPAWIANAVLDYIIINIAHKSTLQFLCVMVREHLVYQMFPPKRHISTSCRIKSRGMFKALSNLTPAFIWSFVFFDCVCTPLIYLKIFSELSYSRSVGSQCRAKMERAEMNRRAKKPSKDINF